MSNQPDIVVTDTSTSPPGHVTVVVDGHPTIVEQGKPAADFIAAEYKAAK